MTPTHYTGGRKQKTETGEKEGNIEVGSPQVNIRPKTAEQLPLLQNHSSHNQNTKVNYSRANRAEGVKSLLSETEPLRHGKSETLSDSLRRDSMRGRWIRLQRSSPLRKISKSRHTQLLRCAHIPSSAQHRIIATRHVPLSAQVLFALAALENRDRNRTDAMTPNLTRTRTTNAPS